MIPLSTKPSTVQQGSPSQSDPEHHCRAQQNRVAFFAFLPRYNVYLYNKRVNERLATAEPTSRIAASLGERGKTRQGPQRGETFEDRRSGEGHAASVPCTMQRRPGISLVRLSGYYKLRLPLPQALYTKASRHGKR